jgi:putative transcriptional regulator
MSNAFSRIKQGLEEANDFAQGNTGKVVVHEFNTIDVKNLRSKIDMSQNEFATAFGISVATFHHWERRDRTPQSLRMTAFSI